MLDQLLDLHTLRIHPVPVPVPENAGGYNPIDVPSLPVVDVAEPVVTEQSVRNSGTEFGTRKRDWTPWRDLS